MILDEELIGDNILPILKYQLYSKLFMYFGQSLQLEFSIFRRVRQSPFDRLFDHEEDALNNQIYYDFVQEFYEGRWLEFFNEYAALAKIVSLISHYWVINTSELLNRVADDHKKNQQPILTKK